MASPTLLLSALPSMVKGAYLLTNKPKKEDYRMRGMEDAFQRMISNNQSDIVGKTLLNQTTSSAKSLGARLYQQSQRGLDIGYERGMLTEGQMAQGLLLSGAGIQEKVGEQQQQGLLAQHQASMQAKERLDSARLELGAVKDQAQQNYLAATQQWKSELFGVGMDLAAVGANMAAASWQDKQNAEYIKNLSQRYGKPFEELNKDEQYNVMMELYLKASGFDVGTHWQTPLKNAEPAGTEMPKMTDAELLEVGIDPAKHSQLDIQPGEEFQQRHERRRQELAEPAPTIAEVNTPTQHSYDDTKANDSFRGYKPVYKDAWEYMKSNGLTPESQEMKEWWTQNKGRHGTGGGHAKWLERINKYGAFTAGEALIAPAKEKEPAPLETKKEEPAKEEKKADTPAPLLEAKNIEKHLPEIKDVKFNEDIKITTSIEKTDFTEARKAINAKAVYDTMFDHMAKMGWDYDSSDMEKWVKSKYPAKGTYEKFKRIYESAMK